MKIQLNLATYEYENKKVTYPFFFFCLFITVFFTMNNIGQYNKLQGCLEKSHKEIEYINGLLTKKETDKNNSKISPKELSRLKKKIDFFNQLLDKIKFSYIKMLNDLEENLPLGVRLKRLDFTLENRSLSIAGEASSHEQMILFLENLEASPNFVENFLSSQSRNRKKRGGREDFKSLTSFNLTTLIKEAH